MDKKMFELINKVISYVDENNKPNKNTNIENEKKSWVEIAVHYMEQYYKSEIEMWVDK